MKSYKPATAEKQRHAENNESVIAKAIGANQSGDNLPMDVTLKIGGKLHGIEVKTMVDNANSKITMHPESRQRKEAWAKTNKGAVHTVVIDDRDKFAGGANKHQYSGHKIYYKSGVGAYRISQMQPVTNLEQLKGLLRKSA